MRKTPNPSDHVKTHVVKQGETLSSIAEQEYADADAKLRLGGVRAIADKNKNIITNPDKIQPGMKLVIPALK